MKLYLVRHGHAEEASVDPQRPLSARGEEEVRRLGRRLKERALAGSGAPPAVFHSDKLRARQTAALLVETLFPTSGATERWGLGPNDDAAAWLPELAAAEEDVMLVGHLPFLANLAGLLLRQGAAASEGMAAAEIEFPAAGVVCLERRGRRWELAWNAAPAGTA
ncbi:MAG: phosphohistidine phosphatase SixA [Candidatus Tectomicrobia bacterium]|nr:phosphohistidine phosphatase SixA [Candidatus Tectomicrobia bacterium]